MLLNERILDESQIVEKDQSKLPPGILSRIRRTICQFNVLNANNRMYEKELWEKVITNPTFKTKLANRQILGEMEHPEGSQIKLDKDRTSHIVSNLYIDENTNSVKCDFDLLPTEAGKFIHILHEAGVKVTASLRADGEIEEKVTNEGKRYHRVKPEAYRFITIDHTGDPSFSKTEPENILKATQLHYESNDINKNVAMALLEYINTPESQRLLEKVRLDKQHKGCHCALAEKDCTGKCGRVNEEITPNPSELDVKAQELFKKPFNALTFQEKEQVMSADKTPPQPSTGSVGPLVPSVEELPKAIPEVGFYKDGKGEVLYLKKVEGDKVVIARQAGQDEVMSIADFNALSVKPNPEAKFPETQPDEEKKEQFEMEEAIQKVLKEATEERSPLTMTPEDVKFEGELWKKSVEELKTIDPDTLETPNQKHILQQVTRRKDLGEKKYTTSSDTSGQPANAKAAAEVARKSAAKSGVKLGEAKLDLKGLEHGKEAIKKVYQDYKTIKKEGGKITRVDIESNLNDEDFTGELSRVELQTAVKRIMKALKENVEIEIDSKVDQYLSDNWASFVDDKEAVDNLIELFKITPEDALEYVEKQKEGKVKVDIQVPEEVEEVKECSGAKLRAAYIQEILGKSEEVKLLTEKLSALTKQYESTAVLLDETKKKNAFLVERVGSLKESTQTNTQRVSEQAVKLEELNNEITQREAANNELRAEIKRLEEAKNKEVKELKESHKRDLIKIYVESRVNGLGLQLPKTTLTLLESCSSSVEVDSTIRKVQDAIREGVAHSASVSEIVQRSESTVSPMQKNIDTKVASVLKNLGV